MKNTKSEETLESFLGRLQSHRFAADPRDDFDRMEEFQKETGIYDNMNLYVKGIKAHQMADLLTSAGLAKRKPAIRTQYFGKEQIQFEVPNNPNCLELDALAQGCYSQINIWVYRTNGHEEGCLGSNHYDSFPRFHVWQRIQEFPEQDGVKPRFQEPAAKFLRDVLCLLKDKALPFGVETYDSIVKYEPTK